MEHGLYLKLEKITNKLAYEKGCIVTDPENYTPQTKPGMISREIPFGKDKGKLEYYDALTAMEYEDFIKRVFAILPRDNPADVGLKPNKTVVFLETLLSDKPCSEEERIKQMLTINRFFEIAFDAGHIGHINWGTKNIKTGQKVYGFYFDEPIPTTYKKSTSNKGQER